MLRIPTAADVIKKPEWHYKIMYVTCILETLALEFISATFAMTVRFELQ